MYIEGVSETAEENGITRRGFLRWLAAGAAVVVGGGILANEVQKPTRNQEIAQKLWDDFMKDPDQFKKNHPGLVHDYLVASKDGLYIRSDASAISRDNIIGHKGPGQSIGTAIELPDLKSGDPDGPWYSQKGDNTMIFFSGKFVEEKLPGFARPAPGMSKDMLEPK